MKKILKKSAEGAVTPPTQTRPLVGRARRDTPFNFDTALVSYIGDDAKSRPFPYVKYSKLSHMTYTFGYI